MTKEALRELLNSIRSVSVCMVGDLCLDAYWHADLRRSRLSSETPHHPLPVVKEVYSLGGGGNVAANLTALGVGRVLPVSVLGEDWRGALTRGCLTTINAECSYVLTDAARVTPCYCKPMRHGISDVVYEDPRLDFENFEPLSAETEARVLAALEDAAARADILAVCDQTACGVVSPAVIRKLNEIGRCKPVVADSHTHILQFEHVIVKPNEREATLALGGDACTPEEMARRFSKKNGAPAIITLGENGALWCEGDAVTHVPAVKVSPPIDIVGAGDTFLSAFCAAYATGVDGATALAFANLASSVTIQKIGTTGTAAPAEILAAFDRLNHGELL